MKKIVITGTNGQLGQELRVASTSYSQFEFIFLTKGDLEISDEASVKNFFSTTNPSFCINCAAYTAVDKAESEKEKAFLINAKAVGIIAAACKNSNAKLIHLSTDYVFDGNSSTPLTEDDAVSPINIYGESKLKGEGLAFKNNDQTIIIRTSWVYSEFGNNFVKTMMRLMKEKESINVINDQIGSPTYAADLANTILQIINSGKFIPGIYNYSNDGRISWYEFATEIKNLIRSSCKINPIPTAQYPTPAKRPHFSLLDKKKIKETYKIEIVDWKKSLAICINRLLK
ncbi:MAG TPA: dTDP-4-dehydrorhamnose reductase [Puia sp.]|nr:dTDP-4-dehydrorhamnose reductase [Puia sp.]